MKLNIILKSFLSTLLIWSISAHQTIASEGGYDCFSTSTKDVCIKVPAAQVSTPLEAFSSGYSDAIISHSGKAIYDAAINYSAGVGQDLAAGFIKSTLGRIAESHGAPSFVLSALGVGGEKNLDITNEQVVKEIDKLISSQTRILVSEMQSLRTQMNDDIKIILSDQCQIQWQEEYDSTMENISRWSSYSINGKTNSTQSVENWLSDLVLSRIQFKTVQEDYCFWGKHVEFYSWLMKLVAIENTLRTELQTITSNSHEDFVMDLNSDLTATRVAVGNIIDNFQVSRTAHILSSDDNATNDKANIWWDDVVLDFTELERKAVHSPSPYSGCTTVNTQSDDSVLKEGSYLLDRLKSNDPFTDSSNHIHVYSTLRHYRCALYDYEASGVKHEIVLYIRSHSNANDHGPNEPSGSFQSEILISESFVKDSLTSSIEANSEYITNIDFVDFLYNEPTSERELLIGDRNFSTYEVFAKAKYKDHMNLIYAQRLQMAYIPYQKLLDNIWTNSGAVRPRNKMDHEYLRTSGLLKLDIDGLSIEEELKIGTKPRNPDSDGDGFNDGFEYHNRTKGFNPLMKHNYNADYDNDGATDLAEYEAGTDIFDPADNPAALAERQRLAAILVPITALILN